MKCNGKKVVTVHDMVHELFPQYFPADVGTSRLKRLCWGFWGLILDGWIKL